MFTADSWLDESLQNWELIKAVIGNQTFALLSFQESQVVSKTVSGLVELEQVLLWDGLDSRTRSGPALPRTFLPSGLHPTYTHMHAHSHTHRPRNASVNAANKVAGRDDLILNLASVTSNQVFFFSFQSDFFFLGRVLYTKLFCHLQCSHFAFWMSVFHSS